MSAFVPCTSKCCGHSGSHHGLDVCCFLKTSRVCAEVPKIAMLMARTRPVMTVWARWSGAGLIFILTAFFFPSLRIFFYASYKAGRGR